MKVPSILITVLLAMSLANGANATSPIPQEIAEQIKDNGQVLATYQLLSDSDLKHLIYAKHGNLFVMAYARWIDNMWRYYDILEVFIAINQKPHILWSRQSPP
jgi:hypothetical protein